MKRTLFILNTVVLFLFSVQAQRAIPARNYMHLVGTVNNDWPFTLHLVKANDSLFGDYTIESSGKNTDIMNKNNQPIQVYGKMDKNGTYWLKELSDDDRSIFKGRLGENQRFSGIWESRFSKGKQLSILLSEKYPDGTLPMNLFYESGQKMLLKEDNSPCATLKLALLVPSEKGNTPCREAVMKIISEKFSGQPCKPGQEVNLLQSMKKTFFDSYSSTNESLYKEFPGASFSWELLKFTHIVYNKNYRMSFYILSYSFTGGAHGQETKTYTNIDLKSCKILNLNDIFKTGHDSLLSRLLTSKLQSMNHLTGKDKLTDVGYFVDALKPTENFYLNENGVGFVYNQYEIAPYAFGQTEIFLNREELRQILK